ncbi:MAG: glycosyltransferase [Tepidisphaeraceae bacterium]
MRILHVISGLDPENGGPTFALIGLAEAQARAGLDVSVLATWQITSGFPLAERLRSNGVPVTLVGPAIGKLSRHADLAGATDRAVAVADVVHIHALWEQVQQDAAVAARRRGVPYVVTPHGMLSPWSLSQGKWLNRWGKQLYLSMRLRPNLDAAAAIHFTTTTERDLVAPLRLRAPAIVEPVGIDFAEFETLPERGAFRAAFPQLGDRPIVLFLSRLSPQKGLDRLIPAIALIAEGNAEAVLAIVGPDYDGYEGVVHALVQRHKLEDRVVFTGMLQGRQRIEAMVDAEMMVLPSHHENFGIVVAEAMASALPVIVSKEVNIWQDVERCGAGVAVSGEPAAVAVQIMRMLEEEREVRQTMGEQGRVFARERYDWQHIARRWVDHYARLAPRAAATSAVVGATL